MAGSQLTPEALSVRAGATVVVMSQDAEEHVLTSTAGDGSVSPDAANGASFDTGPFHGTASFTVPESTPVGTVIHYISTTQGNMMAAGTITVAAP